MNRRDRQEFEALIDRKLRALAVQDGLGQSELPQHCAHCGGAFHEPLTMAAKRHRRDPRAVLEAFRALDAGGEYAYRVRGEEPLMPYASAAGGKPELVPDGASARVQAVRIRHRSLRKYSSTAHSVPICRRC